MKVPVIASKAFSYGGRSLKFGDQFEASQRDARILTGIGRATYATRDMVASPAGDSSESPGEPNSPVHGERSRRKRRRESQRVLTATGTAEGTADNGNMPVTTPEAPSEPLAAPAPDAVPPPGPVEDDTK